MFLKLLWLCLLWFRWTIFQDVIFLLRISFMHTIIHSHPPTTPLTPTKSPKHSSLPSHFMSTYKYTLHTEFNMGWPIDVGTSTGGSIVNLSETTLLEKSVSLILRSYQLSIITHQLSPLHVAVLIEIILWRSYTDSHRCYEFIKWNSPVISPKLCFALFLSHLWLLQYFYPFLWWWLNLRQFLTL